MREHQLCVYMMASGFNGTIYTGVTSNLVSRVMQHRSGSFGGFSAKHGVKRLVWFENAEHMTDAIASEKRIKRWRHEWKMNLIARQTGLA